jgi:predicted DNA-binding transcriptional regulator YafY
VEVVAAREPSAPEAEFLERIEEAAAKRLALRCRYLSSRGRDAWRHLSVQRIVPGPPVRLVAYCHRSERLKWFRVDNVAAAALDPDEPFVRAPVDQVEAMIRSSLDGFADQGPPARYSFLVRLPEARWVAKNLLDGMRAEEIDGGIRVTVETTALPRLARYVVGLGGAARCETPALLEAVAELAQGALRSVAGR